MTSFKEQLDAAYQKKVVDRMNRAVRTAGLSIFREVVMATPVDTGRARANWNIDLNLVDVQLVNPEAGVHNAKDKKGDYTFDGTNEALAAVARYKMSDVIYISNNLPYINRLNQGTSTQAPANFVETGVAIGLQQTKEIMGNE
ncbi:MAG: hypothetical protein JWO78_207 [Micavibrio sp.]|nr:hypothetical protein [Micavibrio sp.]